MKSPSFFVLLTLGDILLLTLVTLVDHLLLTIGENTWVRTPLIHSKINKFTYASILDKVQSRLASWISKVLSMAGRLSLIQFVTVAIPIYDMQNCCQVAHVHHVTLYHHNTISRHFVPRSPLGPRSPRHIVSLEHIFTSIF